MTTNIPTRSVSQLPLASSVSSNNITVIQQDGITKQVALGTIYAGSQIPSVLGYAALRAFYPDTTTLSQGSVIFVRGVITTGIGEGFFYYDSTSNAADNGGTVVVDTAGRRWIRICDQGTFDVTWFGAVGDGSTGSYTALQQAVSAAAGGCLIIPALSFVTSAALNVQSNTEIKGLGPSSILKASSNLAFESGIGHTLIKVVSKENVRFSDFSLDGTPITSFSGGMRAIFCTSSSDYIVENVSFKTPGAAVASMNCSNFKILSNSVQVSTLDGVERHDGVIDQWGGCTDFIVTNNTVKGSSVAQSGILVTGQNSAGSPTLNSRFTVANNVITSCTNQGIWVNGRNGNNTQFTITGNVVDNVSDFHGIRISDSDNGVVSNNTIKNTAFNGIRLDIEGGGGGDGVDGVTVVGNVVVNANTSASANDLEGSAIAVGSGSSLNIIANNFVTGSNHRYAVYFQTGTSANREIGTLGTNGALTGPKVADPGYTNFVSEYIYTPTLTAVENVSSFNNYQSDYTISGEVATVSFKVAVTPTSAGSAACRIGITLPVASNLTSVDTDLHGNAASQFGVIAAVLPDISNDRATLQFPATNTSSNVFYGQFSYRLK